MSEEMKDRIGMMILGATAVLCYLVTGCASYEIKDETGKIISQGNSYGFLRTIEVDHEQYKDGKLVSRTRVSTESKTKDVMMGFNEILDTTANTFDKAK